VRFLERLFGAQCDLKQLSPLTLAFIGDAVFELFVRERFVCEANRPVNDLHQCCVGEVCSRAQAQLLKKILPLLTEEENEIVRRGRNAHTNHVPKNSEIAQYHAATAFEALFGYLYLSGRLDRLRELYQSIICNEK
jgi:ribonuclease III family protein